MQDIWIESFYNEIDAEKRQAFLKEHTGDPKDELDEFREKLWIARYGKRKPKNDAFVGYLMQMKYIAEGGGMSLGAQKRKQAAEVLTGLFLGSYDNLDIEKQEMVFYEIKNAFLKLIGVSKNGRGFTSVVFCMGQLSDESVAKKIADQISTIVFATPHMLHMDKEFAVFRQAALEAFRQEFPNREHFLKK